MKSKSNRKKYRTHIKELLIIFAVVICIAIGFYLLWKSTYSNIITSYGVMAVTERIEIISHKDQSSKWLFENAIIRTAYGEELVKNFSGSIDILDSVNIQVERVSLGPAIVRFYSNVERPLLRYTNYYDTKSLPVSDTLFSDEGIEIVLKNYDQDKINGISHVFHFEGEVILGKINEEVQYGEGTAALRQGEISMLGRNSFDSTTYFNAGEEKLRLGDRLVFPVNTLAVGFISINEIPALTTNFRAESKTATIYKPGMKSQGYEINASTFDKLTNDKDFQRVSVVAGFFLVILTFLTFLIDLTSFVQSNNQDS